MLLYAVAQVVIELKARVKDLERELENAKEREQVLYEELREIKRIILE